MSSAGQPENNDLSRDQGCAPPVRGNRIRLRRGQRHVLAAAAGELRADAELAALFSFFADATSGAAMPTTERLPAWRPLAGRRGRLAVLSRRIALALAVVIPFATIVVALSLALSAPRAGQIRCAPAYAFAPGCSGSYQTPAGVNWQLQGPSAPPAHADGRP